MIIFYRLTSVTSHNTYTVKLSYITPFGVKFLLQDWKFLIYCSTLQVAQVPLRSKYWDLDPEYFIFEMFLGLAWSPSLPCQFQMIHNGVYFLICCSHSHRTLSDADTEGILRKLIRRISEVGMSKRILEARSDHEATIFILIPSFPAHFGGVGKILSCLISDMENYSCRNKLCHRRYTFFDCLVSNYQEISS